MAAPTDQMVINYWKWEVQFHEPYDPTTNITDPHIDPATNSIFLMDPADVNKNNFPPLINKGSQTNPLPIPANTKILIVLQGAFFDTDDKANVMTGSVNKSQAAKESYNTGTIESQLSVDGNVSASVTGELCPGANPPLAPILGGDCVWEHSTGNDFLIDIPTNTHKKHLHPHNFGMIHDHDTPSNGNQAFSAGSHGYYAVLPGFAPNTTHTINYHLKVTRDQNCPHGEGSPKSPDVFESSNITYHVKT